MKNYYILLWNHTNGKAYAEIFTSKKDRQLYSNKMKEEFKPAFMTWLDLTPQSLTKAIQENKYQLPQFH